MEPPSPKVVHLWIPGCAKLKQEGETLFAGSGARRFSDFLSTHAFLYDYFSPFHKLSRHEETVG